MGLLEHRWTTLATAYLVAVLAGDLIVGRNYSLTGLFAIVPLILALEWGPRMVAIASIPLLVLTGTALFGFDHESGPLVITRTAGMAIGAGVGIYAASYRVSIRSRLNLSRAATIAAQEAIIPTVPKCVGPFWFSCAYRAAADESLIGGDFYKVIATDEGARLILGDVQGKGLGAISLTAAILGCFREWTPETATLKGLIERLNTRVSERTGDRQFATAIVAGLDRSLGMEIANCGHPSPIHLPKDGSIASIDPAIRARPLGLSPEPESVTLPLSPGDRILFYTDGLIECRDPSGNWIAVDDVLLAGVASDPLDVALDALLARLAASSGGLKDDVALLLVEYRLPHDGKSDSL